MRSELVDDEGGDTVLESPAPQQQQPGSDVIGTANMLMGSGDLVMSDGSGADEDESDESDDDAGNAQAMDCLKNVKSLQHAYQERVV